MSKFRKSFLLIITVMSILLISSFTQVFAAEFIADLYQKQTGSISSGRVFVKGNLMRKEVLHAGLVTITLFDLERGTAWILNAGARTYAEVPSELEEHPVLLAEKWEALGEVRKVGTGGYEGYRCDILRYEQKKTPDGPLVQWIAGDLGFPVRTELPEKLYLLQYKNIEERPVPAAAFSVPPGYRKVAAPGR
ncbi:MAG: hypothetical protein ACP5DY_06975 [Thermovirgaceae bacterium]